jgi:hypothetical protein
VKLKEPPYEYEYERCPFDLIMGRKGIFEAIRDGEKARDICASWVPELQKYKKDLRKIILDEDIDYDD